MGIIDKRESTFFNINYWDGRAPTADEMANELRRIAKQIEEGYTSGEAFMNEDLSRGWWDVMELHDEEEEAGDEIDPLEDPKDE